MTNKKQKIAREWNWREPNLPEGTSQKDIDDHYNNERKSAKKKQGKRMVTNWDKNELKNKKQPVCRQGRHYIYVAREKNGNLYYSTVKFHKAKICDKYFGKQEKSEHKNKIFCHRSKDMQAIIYCADFARKLKELKKGEQLRIPIPVDEAEVVK